MREKAVTGVITVLERYKESLSAQKRHLKVATFLMLSSVFLERFSATLLYWLNSLSPKGIRM